MSRRKRKSDVAGAVAGAEDTLGKKVPRGTEGTGRQQPPQGPRFRVNPAHDSNAVCGVTLSHDRMEVVGRKGYRMTLGTHGAAAGCWFFEFKVLGLLGSTTDDTDAPPPAVGPAVAPAVAPPGRSEAAAQRTAHTRLGWATAEGNVDAPAGYDRHSFSYGSKSGGRIHQSRRRAYAEAYGPGDVIGCAITVCPLQHGAANGRAGPQGRDRGASSGGSGGGRSECVASSPAAPASGVAVGGSGVEVEGATAGEETTQQQTKGSSTGAGSSGGSDGNGVAAKGTRVSVRFYKNGRDQGWAYRDVEAEDGPYFPAASAFMGGSVRLNPGPSFDFPPPGLLVTSPAVNGGAVEPLSSSQVAQQGSAT